MKLIFTISLFLFSYISFCQFPTFLNQVSPDKVLNDRYYNLADKPNATSLKLPFEKVIVIDRRFDTTKVGYEIKPDFFRVQKHAFLKIKLSGSVASSIEKFYNETYVSNLTKNSTELVIILKTLWVSALPGSAMKHNKEVTKNSLLDVHFKFEYYFKQDTSYTPIKRVDTLFQVLKYDTTSTPDDVKGNEITFLKYALRTMIEKPDYASCASSLLKKPKKTWTEIEKYNYQRFDLPILKDTMKKGIYLSFEEFRNNSPSINDFIRKEIKDRYVFISKDIPVKSFWGFYDGKELGFGTNGKFLMFKVGNTFEVFTPELVLRPISLNLISLIPGSGIIPIPGPTEKTVWCPKQINIETGEVY